MKEAYNRKSVDGIRPARRKKPRSSLDPRSNPSSTPVSKPKLKLKSKPIRVSPPSSRVESKLRLESIEEKGIFSQKNKIRSQDTKKLTDRAFVAEKDTKRRSPVKRLLIISTAFLVFVFILFTFLDKTQVSFIAAQESIQLDQSIKASLYPRSGDLGYDVISVVEKDELLLKPETLVPVSERASGTIRVFNNYSTEPQKLVENTRFETLSGKIFRIPMGVEVIVPGKTSNTAGSADVLVYADQPGPEYNIDLSDFSIPGFKEAGFDDKFAGIYALSLTKMSGGFHGEKKILSDEQKKEAELQLRMQLQDKLEQRIRAEKTNQFFLVKGSSQIHFDELESIGEHENIRLRQSARGSSLIVAKLNFEEFILESFIPDSLRDAIEIDEYRNTHISSNHEIDYQELSDVSLDIYADVIYRNIIDTEVLKQTMIGKSFRELEPMFIENNKISYIKVNVFPFWRKKVSSLVSDIKVQELK